MGWTKCLMGSSRRNVLVLFRAILASLSLDRKDETQAGRMPGVEARRVRSLSSAVRHPLPLRIKAACGLNLAASILELAASSTVLYTQSTVCVSDSAQSQGIHTEIMVRGESSGETRESLPVRLFCVLGRHFSQGCVHATPSVVHARSTLRFPFFANPFSPTRHSFLWTVWIA